MYIKNSKILFCRFVLRGPGGEEQDANPRHTGRDFIKMSFHFNLKRETTTPPKEGRGRKHCPKEAKWSSTTRRKGSQRQGKGTTAQKKQRREQFPSRFRWYCLPSPPWDGSAFPLSPFGWCCWSSSSLLGGGVPSKRHKELRSVTLAEVQFSSVEWWSLLPFSCAAFLCLLFGWSGLASSSFWSCCLPGSRKNSTSPKRAGRKAPRPRGGEAKQHHPTEEWQKRGERQPHPKDGEKRRTIHKERGKQHHPKLVVVFSPLLPSGGAAFLGLLWVGRPFPFIWKKKWKQT